MQRDHDCNSEGHVPNHNCRGCGALIVRINCPYCGRRVSSGDIITVDPKDDPKKNVNLTWIML